MKPYLKRTGLALLGLAVLIQLVPAERSNPPASAPLDAPPEVDAVLRRACYDCHSNETRWPWYSRVAPVSWLVAHDVAEGREALNFSTFGALSAGAQAEAREECYEEAREGEMPLWIYAPLHPSARLSEADLDVLRRWAGARLLGARKAGRDGDSGE